MSYKVLVIEDDQDLNRLVANCLKQKGIFADAAYTGAAGLALLEKNRDYQLIVLDIMLPDIDGFEVLGQIRRGDNVPVLMLTARNGEDDKVRGLTMGADDYLTKPFGIKEFLARVESLIRRYAVFDRREERPDMEFGSLRLDLRQRRVCVGGDEIDLTSREFDLLFFLASNEKQVFTKRQIYRQVWEEEYAFDDGNIMSFISKLRKKLGSYEYIQTVRGVGYRFVGE